MGTFGAPYPSGRDRGESIETRSGLAASVSLMSSSSVRMLFVVAEASSISAQPVARFSLPVKSIPTIRGGFSEPEHSAFIGLGKLHYASEDRSNRILEEGSRILAQAVVSDFHNRLQMDNV